MSSAGSATSLFGDFRVVLFFDLSYHHHQQEEQNNINSHGRKSDESSCSFKMSLLSDIQSEDNSPSARLFPYLKPYHSPPEVQVFYSQDELCALLRYLVKPDGPRITNIILMGSPEKVFEADEQIMTLYPTVVTSKYHTIIPTLTPIIVADSSWDVVSDGEVDNYLVYEAGKEALISQLISDSFVSGSLQVGDVKCRNAVRDFEAARPFRSALQDPTWLATLFPTTYTSPPSTSKMTFPIIEKKRRNELSGMIDEWDFYAPSLPVNELLHVIMLIFERFNLFSELDISVNIFESFLLVISMNYHPNPYHNFFHAVDVLQCCYYVLNSSLMLRRLFRPVDIMALFVAALCHDVGHTSFNNPFHTEHESLLSLLYNDTAVLENMHSMVLFAILRNPRFNWARNWPRGQWKEFRHVVVASILGTDMSQHFSFIKKFQGIDGVFARSLRTLNQGGGDGSVIGGGGGALAEDRKLLAVAVIKFADICNVVRPFRLARKWGFHLVCEFFHQGDWERILGYPNSPLTFRSLPDLSRGQQYFLNNVAGPLYRVMAEYFSELHFAEDNLKSNLEAWRTWKPTDQDAKEMTQFVELFNHDRERHHSNY